MTQRTSGVAAKQGLLFFVMLSCLYFAQGLPFGLLAKALPALARDAGLSRLYIGLLALPAAPWALKFVWAPWVDKWGAGKGSHRKRWIISCQLIAVLLLGWVACQDQQALLTERWWLLLLVLTLLNAVCATQDIATDGLAARYLPLAARGLGNSIQVMGYKIGLILGGASVLMLVSALGWLLTFLVAAVLLLCLLLPLLLWREPIDEPLMTAPQTTPWAEWLASVLPLFRQPGMLIWLLVLMGYKTGEDFATHMVKPWLVDQGWSLAAIGRLDLVAGLLSLLAALLCGVMLRFFRRSRLLLAFALLQVTVVLCWALVTLYEAEVSVVWSVAIFQQSVGSMAAVVLFTVMMDRCRRGHEGADFTVQASVQLSVAGLFVLASGASAHWLGYVGHFALGTLLALAVILPILLLPDSFDRPAHANRQ